MLLVLARHGNTFTSEDTPVWVGAKEDLPLTERGLAQSRQIGAALLSAHHHPDRIIAGPLKRTRIGAELAGEACGFTGEIEIDERLKEIDYGQWGGKSDEDIAAQWGQQAIDNWREKNIAPNDAGWSPSPDELAANAKAVFEDATSDLSDDHLVLVLTSNGILRYFHPLLTTGLGGHVDPKVKTGHWCVAEITTQSTRLLCWNDKPSAEVF
ncbi:histidine phosphatase family protein [Woodsholea maritima]|uniref:histidine phosphatase family protein n=1 Tax=Woodsholea maritima TaxID=240237 RepID=UPI000379F501|nr:histidine phosphatase family protein [Woodsholea maritima]